MGLVPSVKNIAWQTALRAEIEAMKERPASPTSFIEACAKKFNANIHSVRTYYYKCQKEINPEAVGERTPIFQRNDVWKLEVVTHLKENGGKKFRGALKIVKDIAEAHNIPAKTVENAYYRYLTEIPPYLLEEYYKNNPSKNPKATEEDEEVFPFPEPPEEPLNPLATALQKAGISTTEPTDYKPREYVDVKITKIDFYGALVITQDGKNTSGLIHKSNIRVGYVNDVNKWLNINDVISAQIVSYDRVKDRLSLSTRHLQLKEQGVKNLTLSDPLLVLHPTPPPATFERREPGVINHVLQPIQKGAVHSMEIEQIKGYLGPVVGELSPEAISELQKMIEEVGVFRFTMSLGAVISGFKPDMGLILMNNIKNSLGQS